MDDSYLISQLNKHTERISGIEVSIKYLSASIEKLSESIEKLAGEVRRIDEKKGVIPFFKENWYRVPTMIVIMWGVIWSANYVNDNFIPEHKKYKNVN
jgi:hypothetical protein